MWCAEIPYHTCQDISGFNLFCSDTLLQISACCSGDLCLFVCFQYWNVLYKHSSMISCVYLVSAGGQSFTFWGYQGLFFFAFILLSCSVLTSLHGAKVVGEECFMLCYALLYDTHRKKYKSVPGSIPWKQTCSLTTFTAKSTPSYFGLDLIDSIIPEGNWFAAWP